VQVKVKKHGLEMGLGMGRVKVVVVGSGVWGDSREWWSWK
jgi:hypothetical protein